jgi:hypothetical protein
MASRRCGLARPYFTIYEPDCQRYSRCLDAGKARKARDAEGRSAVEHGGAILGVTNPYFEQAFQHWPTCVRIATVRAVARPTRRARYSSASSLTSDLCAGADSAAQTSPVTGQRLLDPLSLVVERPKSPPDPARAGSGLTRSVSMATGLDAETRRTVEEAAADRGSEPLHRAAATIENDYSSVFSSVLSLVRARGSDTSAGSAALRTRLGHPRSSLGAAAPGSEPSSPRRPQPGQGPPLSTLGAGHDWSGSQPCLLEESEQLSDNLGDMELRPLTVGKLPVQPRKAKADGVTTPYRQRLEADHALLKRLLQAPLDTVADAIEHVRLDSICLCRRQRGGRPTAGRSRNRVFVCACACGPRA